jgi:hypothetical protein
MIMTIKTNETCVCSEYNFRLSLEMFTGMPLQVAAQLQINLLVRHVAGLTSVYIMHTHNKN